MQQTPDDALQRFQILETLGQGGMGTVFRARDRAAGRDVALKVVATTQDSSAERFRREGELTARLVHPGIVRVHDAGPFGPGKAYLAYELVEGARTLRSEFEVLERGERLRLLVETGRALGYAHQHGVVHRDVKPANVLIDGDGHARVSDFGVALAQDLESLTKTGAMLGTPLYMAPEAFSSERGKVGPPADVWALGVILYEALAGCVPFTGETPWELAAQIATADPPPLHTLADDVPPRVEQVCMMALAPTPGARYASGEAFADDLERALEGRSVIAPRYRRRRRRPAWLPLLALVPVALLGVLAAGYEPKASVARPAPPTPERTRATKRQRPRDEARRPGWDLRKGQAFTSGLGWLDDREYANRTTGNVDHRVSFTQLGLALTVRDVSARTRTLDATIGSVRLYGTDQLTFSYDSTLGGTHLIPLDHALGKVVTVHVDGPSGRPKKAIGLTAIQELALERTPQALRNPVLYAMLCFDDRGLRRRLELLWHVLPDADGALPTSWELTRSFWPHRDLELIHTLRFERQGESFQAALIDWRLGKTTIAGARVRDVAIECSGRFEGGRVVASTFRFSGQVTSRKDAFRTVQDYWFGDGPFPATWETRFKAPRMLPLPD